MNLVSLNVGLPREIVWRGKRVSTGIWKAPVAGPVELRPLNLVGDGQADLSVHGGHFKAVYVYPSEHYAYWRAELPELLFPWGAFGENLTSEGLLEGAVQIGDRFRIGTAELQVTEPRMPCYKLGIRFERPDMVKRFLASRRTGFYLAVVQPGVVEAGDSFVPLQQATHGVTIADLVRVFAFERDDLLMLRRIVGIEELSESWRGYFEEQLARVVATASN